MPSLSPEAALEEALRSAPPAFRTPFGAVSFPDDSALGKYFHLQPLERGRSLLTHGPYTLMGFEGVCGEGEQEWELPTAALAPAFRRLQAFPGVVSSWTWGDRTLVAFRRNRWLPSLSGPLIPPLEARDLAGDNFRRLAQDVNHNYYWSGDWSPDFYRLQALRGLIAVARDRGDRIFLLPELQHEYAVLDWGNLKADRQTSALVRSFSRTETPPYLMMNPDPRRVLDALEEYWGDQSWILPPYRKVLEDLAAAPTPEFRVWGVELLVPGPSGPPELAAGEVGYTVGKVYTSLSGFFRRDRKEWNNFGKVQLVLLARELESRGYAFHNLGHPYMDYKIRLGARILPRKEFLARWERETGEA